MPIEPNSIVECRICGADCQYRFSRRVLSKYSCSYFYCVECGFLQTEEPYWLDEAYKSAIANADTGLVYRNVALSKALSTLLFFTCSREGKYLDVAGGYGMFTRLMRDIGFDYYWSDIYCQNLLARCFEAATTKPPFTAVTAFEVLEHVPRPLEFIKATLRLGETRTIIFSTELFEGTPPEPESWWYYTFKTGQHVSFYQRRTLNIIGEKLGLNCYSNGSLHMLTDKRIGVSRYHLLTNPRLSRVLSFIPSCYMTSKMMSDHFRIIGESQ